LVRGVKKLELYKNSFVNIGLPFMTQSDPIAPVMQKYLGHEWSLWDRIDVNVGRDLTMREFLDHFQTVHQLEITMMSAGTAVIYNMFTGKDKLLARMATKMSEVVETIQGKKISPKQKYIVFAMCCNDVNGDDADVPEIRYRFKF
jgi:ubiquitin-activating enzyme E1